MSDAMPVGNRRSRLLWSNAQWKAVVAAFALNGFLFGAWASRIPAFKEVFALESGTLGLLLLALAGGAIFSFRFAGALSERWGADRLSVRCAWGYLPALVILAFAPNVFLLGAALFVFGALHGAMDVAMNSWGARTEERLGRSIMSVFHAMFSLGAGLGAASGYAAVKLGFTPTSHFALVAIFGGATALFFMASAQEERPASKPRSEHGPIIALPSGALLLVGLIAFSVSMGEGAMADWSAVFLRLVVDATEAQAALGYAAFSTTMVLTRLFGGFLVQRIGPVMATRMSGVTAFLGLMLAIGIDSLGAALTGFALVGVGYAVVMPLVFSRAARDKTIRSGPAIASVATLGYGGMLLGPPVVGFVAHLTGLRMSFVLLAVLALLAAFLASHLRVEN